MSFPGQSKVLRNIHPMSSCRRSPYYSPTIHQLSMCFVSKVWVAAGLATSGIAAIELGAVAGGGAGLGGGDLIGLVCSRSALAA